ncbi:hypothetical protein HCX49_12760 [Sphingobacterium kitahiroshimense]|uniref:hypothetical protein n=1 Tax=Sphingobacterium sp. B16(2022) TaxID=2914044 RepID=UPI00143AB517|nr:hypothetical protein [Sphingobacterium sp. B16(2022)]NJI74073.1 hypothetical protein [Sphingobacterium sp. B16(2022)]
MNHRLNEQQSLLQVFVSDKPEPRPWLRNLNQSRDPALIFFELDNITLTDGGLSIFSFYGKDLSMRMTTCASESEKKLYSTPDEPVVTFHLQMMDDHFSRFSDDPNQSLWMADQTRLFWQNKETVIYELPDGICNHLDLFFRPDHFLEMADRYPILREMAMEVKTSPSGNLDFFVSQSNDDVDDLVDQLLDELQDYAVSTQRFQHLIECLLLRCMGVIVIVEPIPDDAISADDYYLLDESTHGSQSHPNPSYFYTEELQKLVDSLQMLTEVEVKNKFYEERLAYFDHKKNTAACQKLMDKIKSRYPLIMGDTIDIVADFYFAIAECLDKQYKKYPLDDQEMKIVTEAIAFVCDQSFQLRLPSPVCLELYHKWTKKSYYQNMDLDKISALLAKVISENDLNVPKLDGSPESKAIFSEYMKEQFGLKPISNFMDEGEKDKPKEVTELYQTLIQNLPDEFTITDDGGIKKSDLIRILDFAYDLNDVIPMLLVEIEHFSKDVQYVDKQTFEKIYWWLLAMKERNSDLHEQDLMLRKDRLFGLVQVYESAIDGKHAVEWRISQSREVFVNLASKLIKVRLRMEEQMSRGTFMLCVKAFIRAGDTYKLPKE